MCCSMTGATAETAAAVVICDSITNPGVYVERIGSFRKSCLLCVHLPSSEAVTT
jgi:hypothetical protein